MDLRTQKAWFDSTGFEKDYHCDVPMGAFCSPLGTRFNLWAPTARAVRLNLYAEGSGGAAMEQIMLTKGARGLWSYETKRHLDGVYYDYEVTAGGQCRRTSDPWAKACGVNGRRSMVVDLRRTDPEGWSEDRAPELPPENIIWEVHVKDFSFDPASGVRPEYRGKYLAFTEGDTTLDSDGVHPTCLSYLKRLGVTHVQLMPVYDYGSVDEAGDEGQFNWGYDPVHFNIPEGSYATDPYHGEVRIRELKQAVQALHRAGIRVVMDVVYNHTWQLESPLFNVVPWYFYRQRPDGSASNGSGCGSELATERSMCAKFILDSVLYWAEEFHMDGFRFDLMGLIDTGLMTCIREALDQRYGVGEKLVYGEPWAAENNAARPGTRMCNKGSLRDLPLGVGSFSDDIRDAVKGSTMDERSSGFVNGRGIWAPHLAPCIRGWAGEDGWAKAPSQTIAYLSCHDDWTLWDKLIFTLADGKKFRRGTPEVFRANRLAAAFLFSCQGNLFLHAGEEYGRTKDGVKNSYRSAPEINMLDWRRAWRNKKLADYYRGLIALRKQLPALCDKTEQAHRRLLYVADVEYETTGALLDNAGGKWKRLLLIHNVSHDPRHLPLPAGKWQLLVDGENSFRWKKENIHEDFIDVEPMSAMILGEA